MGRWIAPRGASLSSSAHKGGRCVSRMGIQDLSLVGALVLLPESAPAITSSEDDQIENGGFDVAWSRDNEPYKAERQAPFWTM